MANAALAFLAGLGGGYIQQQQRNREQERQDAKDKRDQDEHDARMAEVKRKADAERALREASQPVTVTDGATVSGVSANPTTYDSADVAASDVRQANRLAQLPQPAAAEGIPAPSAPAATMAPAPVAGGKAFPDAASAQSAATAANAPQAVRKRQVAALRGIDPERADRMEASGIQLEQAAQQAADVNWRRKVSQAMVNGGHEGLAELVNQTEHGAAAGVKLQAVPSADGKTVTYNKVDKDGKLTPTGLTFTNDGEGIARAAAALDGAISPMDRVKMAQADAKEAREGRKTDAEVKKADAEATKDLAYADFLAGAKSEAERAKANKTPDGKPFKLDEDDKLRLTEASKGVQEATKAYGEALGKLMPGQKPEESPAVQFAANQLKQAKLSHLRTNIELGQISPEAMANQVLGVAKNPQEVLRSLTELASLDGDFSEKVANVVTDSDVWKRMSGGSRSAPPKTEAGKKIAAAPAGSVALQPDGSYAAPGTRPAAAAGMPAPAGVPAATTDAGKRLDEARAILKTLRASAPGLAKGKDAIAAHAESVRAAEKELADAEAAYQRMVEGSVKPYFGAGRAAPAAAAGMTAVR